MSLILRDEPVDGVVRLTLNRPEKRNALSWALADELSGHLARLHDEDARVVVIGGAGPMFCAGADMIEQFSSDRQAEQQFDIGRAAIWGLLETLPQVAIAAVHGKAITGGFLLAYCCDLIVAEESAVFRDTHAVFGLTPTGGEAQRLLARLGPNRTRDLMFTSRPLDAATAAEWGLVNRLCPTGTVADTALEVAQEILACDPTSVRDLKRMINTGVRTAMASGLLLDDFVNGAGTANVRRARQSLGRVDDFFKKDGS